MYEVAVSVCGKQRLAGPVVGWEMYVCVYGHVFGSASGTTAGSK